MRFVAPEPVTIQRKNGKDWIEVKRELSAGADQKYRTAGFRRVSQREDGTQSEVDVDWQSLAMARIEAYLVDWSATDAKNNKVKVSRDSIAALSTEDFEEIDEAIKAHVEAMAAEKKARAAAPISLPVSA